MPLIEPMRARDPQQPHRAATTLELFFDLIFVLAIASAAAGLHHAIAEAHALQGIVRFAMAFFAIWWAWMTYTWFASSYDNGDVFYRLLTLTIMAGALTIAAGIGPFFEALDIRVIVIGYSIMRVAMITLWVRASVADPVHEVTTRRYAIGTLLLQIYWVGLLLWAPRQTDLFYPLFVLGVLLELAVPLLAERAGNTPWHRHHIIERYGLLTIIVLGEALLSATLALRAAIAHEYDMGLIVIAGYALCVVCSMWWLYFAEDEHLSSTAYGHVFVWGYGHAVIFAAAAAVGAGFAVAIDVMTHHAELAVRDVGWPVAIPLALFLFALWLVRDRISQAGAARWVLPGFAVAVLLAALAPAPLAVISALTVSCVVVRGKLAVQTAH